MISVWRCRRRWWNQFGCRSMDSKQKKVFGSAHSNSAKRAGLYLFLYRHDTKSKTDTTLSSNIRDQFATKILLGSANAETPNTWHLARSQQGAGLNNFKGFYISDSKTGKKSTAALWLNLHTHHLENDLKCFEQLIHGFSGQNEHKKTQTDRNNKKKKSYLSC